MNLLAKISASKRYDIDHDTLVNRVRIDFYGGDPFTGNHTPGEPISGIFFDADIKASPALYAQAFRDLADAIERKFCPQSDKAEP
jgi:hypothetical protein